MQEINHGGAQRQAAQQLPPELLLPRFVTVRELAARIARNEFTVYHWTKDEPERLPRITRLHGRVLFLEAHVQEWFAAQQHDLAAQAAGLRFDTIEQSAPVQVTPRRGAPTKAERVARRQAQSAVLVAGGAA
jgi:predicted DNA-binding transcriptional regulator AlpA